ncbi:DNA polymerase III subunit gamma/tau [Lacipirellula sp.]|uniref:DNA polymerase III subunit gamma/tau n=1 Tax=Lacipirellula sp. TaxID=2691419 RepID=UPI003D0F0251
MNESLPPSNADTGGEYVVVARRYRPQAFDQLVGQEHVAKALKGAIESDRVGHAYLFTGARGVGKTSSARILAKALNCERGTSAYPCGECEVCQSIASGDDVDVLEIDGASNRGIDEIRQLRQNVAVRPARARFKIYIIDEVHMLTKEAFNALLKTLEEPPEHVKFIFATTEANKIPITILSRCQRYDFAGIEPTVIHKRLSEIAANEGVEVDSDALQIIAMRAAGSMRDSQSLLEQLLSTGSRQISTKDVTELLGLAPAARLTRLVEPLVNRDAAAALAELDAAIVEGAEVGQLIDQLLGYFRDAMTQAVGCDASQLLYALPTQQEEMLSVGQRLGVQTLLAISQVLDQTAARLRVSTQVRTLAEMALVRICHLQNLDEIAALIEQLKGGEALPVRPVAGAAPAPMGSTAALGAKKNAIASPAMPTASPSQSPALPVDVVPEMAARAVERPPAEPVASIVSNAAEDHPRAELGARERGEAREGAGGQTAEADGPGNPSVKPAPAAGPVQIDAAAAERIWREALEQLEAISGVVAASAHEATRISADAQGRLVVSFPESKKYMRETCLRPQNLSKLDAVLEQICGGRVPLTLTTHADPAGSGPAAAAASRPNPKQQQADAAADPFVKRAVELFDADADRLRYVAPRVDAPK